MRLSKVFQRSRALFALSFVAAIAACSSGAGNELAEPNSNSPQDGAPPMAPQLLAPADDATITDHQPAFTWQFEPCQDRVIVQICGNASCDALLHSFTSESCNGARADKEFSAGVYYWRAAQTDGQRLASAWSAIRRFVIVEPPAVTADLFGVFSVSPTDVWAVGAAGTILHYDGVWSAEKSTTTQDLRAVWGAPGQKAWAVGAGGTILRRSGTAWGVVPSPTTEDLNGVWASGMEDAWAVGNAGLILHWDGASWTIAHDRHAGTLRGIWGSAANDVWVVGSGKEPDGDYASLLLHWDGATITESYLCNPEGTRYASGGWIATLQDVWGVMGGTLWAAGACQSGASFIPYGFVAQKEDGSIWHDSEGFGFGLPLGKGRPLRAIWSSSDSDVWAASGNELVNGTAPSMLHWDGKEWTTSPQNITAGVYDLGGTSRFDVWAVGKAGKRLHYDGASWLETP